MSFPLHILAADSPFFEGACESLVVPTLDGQYGVLAGHCNTICAIVPGTLSFRTAEGETVAAVAAGIMKIENGEVLVLVDSALRPEEVDEERQRRAADEIRTLKNAALDRAAFSRGASSRLFSFLLTILGGSIDHIHAAPFSHFLP